MVKPMYPLVVTQHIVEKILYHNKLVILKCKHLLLGQSHTVKNITVKGALSGLRQFLAPGSSLKAVKNAFYFTLKALFVLKIFTFLS